MGFEGEDDEVVEDFLGFDLEVGRDGVVGGKLVVGSGDGFVDVFDLARHAFFDAAHGGEVFVELVAV